MGKAAEKSAVLGTLIVILVVAILIAAIMIPVIAADLMVGCIAFCIPFLMYLGLLALFGHRSTIEMGLLVVLLAALAAIFTLALIHAKAKAEVMDESSQIQHRILPCSAPPPTAS